MSMLNHVVHWSHLGTEALILFEVLSLNAKQNIPQLSQSCTWSGM